MCEFNHAKGGSLKKISICVPCYNSARTIGQTLQSISNQQCEIPIELIIHDGGSTDGTLGTIEKFATSPLPQNLKVQFYSEKDNGQYDALNRAFAKTTGDVMTYINADDLLSPWAVQTALEVMKENPEVVWLTGNNAGANPSGCLFTAQEIYFFQSDIRSGRCDGAFRPMVQQEGTMWTRGLWEKAGSKLDTRYKLAADFDLWHRFGAHAELSVINSVLGIFRFTGQQKTHSKNAQGQIVANLTDYLKEVADICSRSASVPALDNDTAVKYQWRLEHSRWVPHRIKRRDIKAPSVLNRLRKKLGF